MELGSLIHASTCSIKLPEEGKLIVVKFSVVNLEDSTVGSKSPPGVSQVMVPNMASVQVASGATADPPPPDPKESPSPHSLVTPKISITPSPLSPLFSVPNSKMTSVIIASVGIADKSNSIKARRLFP